MLAISRNTTSILAYAKGNILPFSPNNVPQMTTSFLISYCYSSYPWHQRSRRLPGALYLDKDGNVCEREITIDEEVEKEQAKTIALDELDKKYRQDKEVLAEQYLDAVMSDDKDTMATITERLATSGKVHLAQGGLARANASPNLAIV